LTAGAALAVAGALMQALTRNPLAEPGLLGVSNGAAVAAVGFIVLGDPLVARAPAALVPFLVPVAAFLGALATTALILALARGRDGAGSRDPGLDRRRGGPRCRARPPACSCSSPTTPSSAR
jgi:iron complex transport system permease protein